MKTFETDCFPPLTGPSSLFCLFRCVLKKFSLNWKREFLLLIPE